ncbi:cell division protein FtsW [Gracilibacillus boraciitolerans JCM 21714]|uniref:Probable peptidoglycan glycosyltransferase FtsW n=1 Tax=Gracilibacillus boraciitolerans JCM 21714 TaxID=1298598 RepID=W4VEF4_9BACI|nr:FtsW/RodA/SpoVE family cell cycle protein [Gracilibacillus boraciitolerans]GAE91785.1 cell division protein FtsW [Gracilibacillus boraciitolerans JCM 21714]
MKQKTKTFDFLLMLPPVLLAGFGIVMIYSASMVTSVLVDNNPAYEMALKQGIWLVIGLIGFLFACFFNYKIYQKLTKWIVLIMIIALLAVKFFGVTINYSTSWIHIGSLSIQPSEFVKIGLIIYLPLSIQRNKHI